MVEYVVMMSLLKGPIDVGTYEDGGLEGNDVASRVSTDVGGKKKQQGALDVESDESPADDKHI